VSDTQDLLRFGLFELNVTTEELRKSGTLIRLAPQPLKLLALLARRSGQVVTREEIQQSLWGSDTYVDFEQGMNHCIKQIRTALGDSADSPVYIETVPRRGYRFLAPVVTKKIPVPPPQVRESESGIQGRVSLPAAGPPYTPPLPAKAIVLDRAATTPPAAGVESRSPASREVSTQGSGSPAGNRVRWIILVTALILLLAVIAGILLWRSRKIGLVVEEDAVAVAQLEPLHAAPVSS
jgi:DNA-binding winged helix-turn-helix (wHTH) protein